MTGIGNVIRTRREARGISLRGLARILGCNPSAVWTWEHDVHAPSAYYVRRIEPVLGYKLGALLRQM